MYWTFSIKSVYITSLSEKPYKVLIYCHPNHLQILAYYLPSILLPSGNTTIYQAGFKLNIQKAKIMAPGPITSWQIDGEKLEIVTDFIFLGSKITVDGDWSHEIKRCLLLGRKAMTDLDTVLKSRDITLPTKDHIVKASVFPVVMYRLSKWMWVGP